MVAAVVVVEVEVALAELVAKLVVVVMAAAEVVAAVVVLVAAAVVAVTELHSVERARAVTPGTSCSPTLRR